MTRLAATISQWFRAKRPQPAQTPVLPEGLEKALRGYRKERAIALQPIVFVQEANKASSKGPIIVAIITAIGVVGGAAIANWDKLFPKPPPPSATYRPAGTPGVKPGTNMLSLISNPSVTLRVLEIVKRESTCFFDFSGVGSVEIDPPAATKSGHRGWYLTPNTTAALTVFGNDNKVVLKLWLRFRGTTNNNLNCVFDVADR